MTRTRGEAHRLTEQMGKREPERNQMDQIEGRKSTACRAEAGKATARVFITAFAAAGQSNRHQDTMYAARETREKLSGSGHGQASGWMDGWMGNGGACGPASGRTART